MKLPVPILALAMSQVSGSTMPGAEATTYVVRPEKSDFRIEVGTSGVFGFLGHEHLVSAKAFKGTVRWNAAAPQDSSVELTFDAAGVEVLDPDFPESKRAEVQADMETKVLNLEKYRTIRFVSERVVLEHVQEEPGVLKGVVVGNLTLHGTTAEIAVPLRLTVSASSLRAQGSLTLKGSRFGIERVSAGAGTVKTSDELDLRFDIVATPQPVEERRRPWFQSGRLPSAARRERVEVVEHGRDGYIQDSDSYGRDPFPPRDKKH